MLTQNKHDNSKSRKKKSVDEYRGDRSTQQQYKFVIATETGYEGNRHGRSSSHSKHKNARVMTDYD